MGISKYAPVEDHEAKSNPHPQYALASEVEAVRVSILAVKTSIRTVTNEITNTTTTPLAIGDPVAESVIGGILFVGANNLLAQDASLAWDFAAKTLTLPNTGLHILDTNASHDLIIQPGSNLTADRILTFTTGDAARTITLSGNPTLSDWFDQSVKVAASPTFAALTTTGASGIVIAEDSGITMGSAGSINNSSGVMFVNGDVSFEGAIQVAGDDGATGTFLTVDLKTITVTNGIITTIV